jgi:hypothetical protein
MMSSSLHSFPPAALSWQENGELATQDLFQLLCRLRAVEPEAHGNELGRLGQKEPRPLPSGQHARQQISTQSCG